MNLLIEEIIAAECVGRGVELLAEHGMTVERLREIVFPHGFSDCAFDMGDSNACVLARVFGTYCRGLIPLDLTHHQAAEHGFEVHEDYCDSYATLTVMWERVLVPHEWDDADQCDVLDIVLK